MAKLYDKQLDDELAKRKQARENRLNSGLTLRNAAKNNTMGLDPSEYCAWENGEDICPHENYEPMLGNVHPPFLVFDKCVKCGHVINLCKADDDKERALEAFRLIKKKANNDPAAN